MTTIEIDLTENFLRVTQDWEVIERSIEAYMSKERRFGGLKSRKDEHTPIISLKDISHQTKHLYCRDGKVIAILEILPTPNGSLLEPKLKSDSIRPILNGVHDEEFIQLISIDFVYD